MSKNRKKIIGTLLGIMASVSSAGAMQNDPNAGSTNTETVEKSKKRNQDTTSFYWNVAKLVASVFATNEIGSNLPVVKNCTYPLLRQLSGYRVRRNVRGEFHRSNGLKKVDNSFNYKVLNETDGEFYCLSFNFTPGYYKEQNNKFVLKTCLKKIENVEFIDNIKTEGNLVINPTPSGATIIKLSMESDDGTVLNSKVDNFLKSDNFDVDDAADALSKAISFVKLINSNKSNDEKFRLINKNFDVLYAPKLSKEGLKAYGSNVIYSGKLDSFRIFVKERQSANGEMRKIYAEFQLIPEENIKQQEQGDNGNK